MRQQFMAAVLTLIAIPLAPVAAAEPPPTDGAVDYQLGSPYEPPANVSVVTRDWRVAPAPGTYGICYINAFQTQPEHAKRWRKKHPELLLRSKSGRIVEDRNWPGEFLLNTSTKAKRNRLATIVTRWIDRCSAGGYQAVEPDNLDSWTRSKGRLSRRDNARFARELVRISDDRGLAVAQKNTAELLPQATAIGFDFAVVEECQRYGECGRFAAVYGTNMIEIEYRIGAFNKACRKRGASISIVHRDLNLRAPGDPGYRYDSC